jgi:hypothetical protein
MEFSARLPGRNSLGAQDALEVELGLHCPN